MSLIWGIYAQQTSLVSTTAPNSSLLPSPVPSTTNEPFTTGIPSTTPLTNEPTTNEPTTNEPTTNVPIPTPTIPLPTIITETPATTITPTSVPKTPTTTTTTPVVTRIDVTTAPPTSSPSNMRSTTPEPTPSPTSAASTISTSPTSTTSVTTQTDINILTPEANQSISPSASTNQPTTTMMKNSPYIGFLLPLCICLGGLSLCFLLGALLYLQRTNNGAIQSSPSPWLESPWTSPSIDTSVKFQLQPMDTTSIHSQNHHRQNTSPLLHPSVHSSNESMNSIQYQERIRTRVHVQ